MPKFKYRMQSILNLKYKMESQARTEFGVAKANLNKQEELLETLIQRKNIYFEEGKKLRNEAKLSPFEIRRNYSYIDRMDEAIEIQNTLIKEAERIVDKKRDILINEMKERKIHEKLREKAFERYMQEEKKAEFIESDQRSSFVYGQKDR